MLSGRWRGGCWGRGGGRSGCAAPRSPRCWRGEAGPVAEEVVAHTTDLVVSARMRVIATRCAGMRGDFPHALALTIMPDQDLPDSWRARLLAWNAMALRYHNEPEQAHDRAVQ